jgi:hypothetical protein
MLAPHRAHQFDALRSPRVAAVERSPEDVELLLHPTHAGTEDGSTAVEEVDGGELLAQNERVAFGDHNHQTADPDPRGQGGEP